jgi:putative RNA 2'-phosphotransferase
VAYGDLMTDLSRASRYIAWALRHAPDKANLAIDRKGWASLDDLIRSLHRHGFNVTKDMVRQIVADDPKRRYELSSDERRIRANYGHSIEVALTVPPEEPPSVLYHGTARHILPKIKETGLLPQGRQYVHLSDDVASAISVGSRHGRPVVISVNAKAMYDDGLVFYPAGKHVWLTATVPTNYLDLTRLVF